MKSYISKIKKTFFLDNNEFLFRKFFGIFPKKNESREKKTIIFNASENYYDLCYSYLLNLKLNLHVIQHLALIERQTW